MKKKPIIISLGGSLIVPDNVDVFFLKKFKELILKEIKKGKKFIIFTGGGATCRKYQKAARKLGILNPRALDQLGIYTTYLNALLVKFLFGKKAFEEIIKNPTKKIKTNKNIIIAAGWKPGWSTDYDAVKMAQTFKVKEIINATNVDYIFDKDPKKFKDAKSLKHISFSDLLKITGRKWKPGLHLPFDPIALKEAQKLNLKIIFINGKKLKNFQKVLEGKKFKGTTVTN